MHKLITLNKNDNIIVSSEVENFFDPDYIYVPYLNNNTLSKNVLKNQIITKTDEKVYLSSISGCIENIENKTILNKQISTLKIKNDFKEKMVKDKIKIKDFDDVDLFTSLKDLHLDSILEKLNSNAQYLLINGITDEPYVLNEQAYLKNYSDEILETIDFLSKKLKITNNIISLKTIDQENIFSFLALLGSYPEIHLILLDDLYLLEKDYFILEKLKLNSKETIILNPFEIYQIYNAIRYGKKLDEKYITIAGDGIPNGKIINTKLYVSVHELLNAKMPITENNVLYYVNGLMTGREINPNTEIVTTETEAIFIMKKSNLQEAKCFNCGKCYEICPIRVNPKYAMDYHKTNKNCLDCGLCSYICPAKINLRKYLKGEENE